MRMKILAGSGFFLNTLLFATYYAVTKEALSRIDPIIFTFFEMVSLVPVALLIILCTWKTITREVIKRGILLGSTLCLALFTIAIALKYTTATSTAFFPALNGFVAAIIAWTLFRQPMKGSTWLAGLLSLSGAALLIFSSSLGNLRGTLIAFLGGLFYICYIFLCDREQKDEQSRWSLFGIELLTTAVWANLVALLFGDWQASHPALPKDIEVVLYVSAACTFVPVLITVLLQKYISPVTVSFIYILEPVLGAGIAYFYLSETLPLAGYIGGGLVVLGAVINTCSTIRPFSEKRAVVPPTRASRQVQPVQGSWVSTLLYPGISCLLGSILLYNLGGVPPGSWRDVYHLWPQIPQYMQQGQGSYVTLLLIQAGGWLVAWLSVFVMGGMACYHAARRLLLPAQPRQIVHSTQQVAAQPAIQPVRRVRTTRRLPEQPVQPVRASARLQQRPVLRARPTVSLPEQPDWYDEPTWNVAPPATGSGRSVPSTEPLHPDAAPLKRRASLERQEVV